MPFTKTSENQVQCTCGRFYNVGDYCGWCQKTVEQTAEQPAAEMPEGEQVPAPPAQPEEEPPVEEEHPSEDEDESAAAEAAPVAQPIATPPPVEGRRSRRER